MVGALKILCLVYKDIAGNNCVDKLAYLSDIPTEFVSSINGISGVSTIPCSDNSINVNNGANIISLSANVGVKSLNNLTNDITFIGNDDGTISIDSSQPNIIRLRAIGGGGGGTAFDGNLDANLNIGHDTTNYVINLNDGTISSEIGILNLSNSNITLNGNITFDGDIKLSSGKKFFRINSSN
jgi:hypothetical protein